MQWTYHVYTFVYIYISLAKTFLLTKTLKYMYVCIMSIARKRLNGTIQYFVGAQARLGISIRLAEIVQTASLGAIDLVHGGAHTANEEKIKGQVSIVRRPHYLQIRGCATADGILLQKSVGTARGIPAV